jgi:hypothetical protein
MDCDGLHESLINTTQAHFWDPFQVELAQRSSAEHRHMGLEWDLSGTRMELE